MEGAATPFSSGGSSCVNKYVTFGRKAQLHPPAVVAVAAAVIGNTRLALGGARHRGVCPGVHALGDDRSSFILARIAAGKEDGNDADVDNKIESDLSHEMSEDQSLVDLSRQHNQSIGCQSRGAGLREG